MTWDYFIYFAIASVLCWIYGAYGAWKGKTKTAYTATIAGLLVEIQMDIEFLNHDGSGVHLCEPLQARDSQQDADASFAKPLVCSPCNRIYVCIRLAGCRYCYGTLSVVL